MTTHLILEMKPSQHIANYIFIYAKI